MCENNDLLYSLIFLIVLMVMVFWGLVSIVKYLDKPGPFQRLDIEFRERREQKQRRRRGDA